MKTPPNYNGIRLELIGVNFPFKVIPERWSTLYRLDIPRNAFDSGRSIVRANIAFDLTFVMVNKNRVSHDIGLSDLTSRFSSNSPDPFTDYLEPHHLVESNSKEISERANQIVDSCMGYWEATRSLAEWINEYIVYSYELQGSPYQGALTTLRNRLGTCSDFVHLFLAMSRAVGIPSRAMLGINRQGRRSKWSMHSWAEVLDPEFGWISIDLVTQPVRFVRLGNDYIPLSAGFNCENRLFAYFFTPKDAEAGVKVRLYATINSETVEIEFFEE